MPEVDAHRAFPGVEVGATAAVGSADVGPSRGGGNTGGGLILNTRARCSPILAAPRTDLPQRRIEATSSVVV